jgi:NAD-dependent deacetylase
MSVYSRVYPVPVSESIARVADALRRARVVTALTGAGVSAASGIPTFRGAGRLRAEGATASPAEADAKAGLWKKVRAETLATPEAFEHDPRLVWEWYDWRRGMIRDAKPNPAHDVLAAWTCEQPGFTLITQNVDGLHERAGACLARAPEERRRAERLIRLHGSIWHVRCWNACAGGRADWRDDTTPFPSLPPRCPHCGGLVRPGVVWFGESLDPDVVDRATAATACDVFLTIGTSAIVYPAAGLVHHAKRRGAMTVEINLDATAASDSVDVSLRGHAAEILLALQRLKA